MLDRDIAAPEAVTEVKGWIRNCRRQKAVTFATVTDGSNARGLQAVVPRNLSEGLSIGAAVRLSGKLVDSPGKGQARELQVDRVDIVGTSDAETYPVPNLKQGLPLPLLRKNAHLRARTAQTAAMLRVRSEMSRSAHAYFHSHDFLDVQTPLMTSSDCEGAGEVFRVESGPTPPPPTEPDVPLPPDRYLTVSSQLHLEALTASIPRAYTLSPAFRAESSDTARHLQEFWMLEAEMAFLPQENALALGEVMDVVENLVKAVAKNVVTSSAGRFFHCTLPELERHLIELGSSPFERITYMRAIEILSAENEANPERFAFTPSWGASIQTEHEKWLAESHFGGPVFVTDYPRKLKPWYMLPNDGEEIGRETVACFDLLVPRLGELVGGSLREWREDHLERALETHGLDKDAYEWYLDLRKYGSTPHGGFGLGWERLASYLTGIENVRECIAFPRASEGSRF